MAPGWARSNSRRPRLRLCRDHRAALLAKRPCLDSRTVPSPESKAILARRSSGSGYGTIKGGGEQRPLSPLTVPSAVPAKGAVRVMTCAVGRSTYDTSGTHVERWSSGRH
jgi:hypothetical protein